jgi:DUF4097 and DUF4098 domain-containing protein YvlB
MRTFVLLLVGGLCTGGFALAHSADNTFERRLPADPHGIVEISNVSGRVEVTAWDKPEVEVRGELGSSVERVDVTGDHGRVVVKVIVHSVSFGGAGTNLRVHIPKESELDFSGTSSDFTSNDVQGPLMLKSVSGDIKADVYGNNVEVKTVSGDIALRGHGQTTSIHIGTISGNVRADRIAGDVEATSVSGDMTMRLETARMVRLRATSGDIGFEGRLMKSGSFDAETVSGDVTVRGASESGIDYEVNTFSGDIQNCMGAESMKVSKYGPGKRLAGTSKDSGARVRVKTMSGDVELCDKK